MLKTILHGAALTLLTAHGTFAQDPAASTREHTLAPEHRRFIEQEAVYIIAPREKEVFEQLTTYEERERFIKTFWDRRDPNPATPENEFKDEHFRRIEYANEWLGRETSLDGWKTDRGRMYIILGPPRSVQKWEDQNDIVPTELWFYSGSPKNGLPPNFYLLFFQKNYVGEYQLYNPVADGPEKLVRGATAFQADKMVAMQTLKLASVELARASLTFDLGETVDFNNPTPSLSAGILIDRIEDSPLRAVRTDYVDAWLRYGNRVSAEYSFNYVPNRGAMAVLVGPERTPFLHFAIELDPEHFSMESDEKETRFYTTLDASVEVRTAADGQLVTANEREIFLELSASQMAGVRDNPIAYLADLPLLPGEYNASVVIRNRVSKQYTVLEHALTVPSFDTDTPTMSDIMLGYEVESVVSESPDEMRAFQLGGSRLSPAADGGFAIGETAHFILQVVGADPNQQIRLTMTSPQDTVRALTLSMRDYPDGVVVESLDTRELDGARYVLTAELVDADGDVLARREAPLSLSPRTALSRPGVLRRSSFGANVPGMLALARGSQLLALGRYENAVIELENAIVRNNPNLPMAKWQLAAALLETGEPVWAKKLLSSIEAEFPNQFEVIAGLGFANYQTANFEDAVRYLEQAMTLRPPEAGLLNTLGDSYDQLGNKERARESFERSLELNPNQPEIQVRLDNSRS